jgi:3-deoxy-manno-octulosonate cytidylyltransferase (CMP-KDO synthetase)
MAHIIGIIPARYGSTRFPAKALADVGGKTMLQRVHEQAQKAKSLNHIVVATDHPDIQQHVQEFGGEACLTKEVHISGTDRCYEALLLQHTSYDYVINIPGDEPFIVPDQIDLLASALNGEIEIATLVKQVDDPEQLFSPNIVKVVFSAAHEALYFSRSAIPHLRALPEEKWIMNHAFYKHIGMYAYRTDVLEKLTQLPVSVLEQAESLEQLRWLENEFSIRVIETKQETIGIDTPDDLVKALAYLNDQ